MHLNWLCVQAALCGGLPDWLTSALLIHFINEAASTKVNCCHIVVLDSLTRDNRSLAESTTAVLFLCSYPSNRHPSSSGIISQLCFRWLLAEAVWTFVNVCLDEDLISAGLFWNHPSSIMWASSVVIDRGWFIPNIHRGNRLSSFTTIWKYCICKLLWFRMGACQLTCKSISSHHWHHHLNADFRLLPTQMAALPLGFYFHDDLSFPETHIFRLACISWMFDFPSLFIEVTLATISPSTTERFWSCHFEAVLVPQCFTQGLARLGRVQAAPLVCF